MWYSREVWGNKNWTNVFAERFSEVNAMCVQKFKGYWLKKSDSRKAGSPFFQAKAVCKFESCRTYILYIENVDTYDNGIIVKFNSEGILSSIRCATVHSRICHIMNEL